MAGLNFRIGTKLGLTAGAAVGLVMHANQLRVHPSITETSHSVSASRSHTSSAQTTDNRMMRAPLAIRDTRAARSAAAFDRDLSASARMLAWAWPLSTESHRLKTDVENVLDTVRTA